MIPQSPQALLALPSLRPSHPCLPSLIWSWPAGEYRSPRVSAFRLSRRRLRCNIAKTSKRIQAHENRHLNASMTPLPPSPSPSREAGAAPSRAQPQADPLPFFSSAAEIISHPSLIAKLLLATASHCSPSIACYFLALRKLKRQPPRPTASNLRLGLLGVKKANLSPASLPSSLESSRWHCPASTHDLFPRFLRHGYFRVLLDLV